MKHIRTGVYTTHRGPVIGVYVHGERTELSPLEAEELMAELADRIDECEAERQEIEKQRIQRMRDEYEDRKAVQHG